jgi:4-methylaminobutanoate oxidase (formaldehyde-forming)
VSANAVNGEPGVITYTQWLNESGRLEADLTVTKVSDDEFLVVASDTAHRHALTHLRRAIGDSHAFVADVTSGLAMLSLQGPRSREVLAAVTGDDVSDAALGYRSVREIQIGFARVTCARITYVGELGYELYVPTEQAVHVYDRIVAAGIPLGLRHVGLSALSSLRLEKGYRDYGHDIDNTDDPFEVGLGFAVAMDKPGGFIGRDAVAERRAAGPLTQRLVSIRLTDPDAMLFHAEPVLRDGVAVGYVRVGSYGHTLGGSVGLAFVSAEAIPCDSDWLAGGTWEVNVAGTLVPAEVSIRPFYDPKNERLRA